MPVGKGATRRAYGMVITLPFSAAHAVVYTHAQTTADAVPALYGCLERLGGVSQRLVVDRGMRSTPIMTSWGYPFAWRFCSVMAMFGRKYLFRSAESVVTEIEQKRVRIFKQLVESAASDDADLGPQVSRQGAPSFQIASTAPIPSATSAWDNTPDVPDTSRTRF